MAHAINRKKGEHEITNIDPEQQAFITEMAAQFQKDQVKAVLRVFYKNVMQYGPEAIMKAMEQSSRTMKANPLECNTDEEAKDQSFVEAELEVRKLRAQENLSVIGREAGIRHDAKDTLKRNAQFLIESSAKLGYDRETLDQMQRLFAKGNYDDVIDLAFLNDKHRRPFVRKTDEEKAQEELKEIPVPRSAWEALHDIIEEVAEEEQEKMDRNEVINCCKNAIKQLSGDLSYKTRASAREQMTKILNSLVSENDL